jgi:hypothetical protein
MTGDHLRRVLGQTPFVPFTMGLTGKTRVRVERPDWAVVSPDGQTLHVFDARGLHSAVSLAHVASITFDPPPPEPDVIVTQ